MLENPTYRDVLHHARDRLAASGAELPEREAVWLTEEAFGTSRARLLTLSDDAAPAEGLARLDALLERRVVGEPLQYVLGHADFFGLRLAVTPTVLIPRPETEQVAEHALDLLKDVPKPRLLDAGTGSGALALALAHERPDADVYACDVSADALAVARDNAQALDLDVRFAEADLLAPDVLDKLPRGLDLLVSNPPYVPRAEAATLAPHVRDHEPGLALFVDDDPLLFYRVLARLAHHLLKPGALLVAETHADYGDACAALCTDTGLTDARCERDLAGRPRILVARRPA